MSADLHCRPHDNTPVPRSCPGQWCGALRQCEDRWHQRGLRDAAAPQKERAGQQRQRRISWAQDGRGGRGRAAGEGGRGGRPQGRRTRRTQVSASWSMHKTWLMLPHGGPNHLGTVGGVWGGTHDGVLHRLLDLVLIDNVRRVRRLNPRLAVVRRRANRRLIGQHGTEL